MSFKMSKTPLMIAAIATAVALTSSGFARANGIASHAPIASADSADVVQANFKVKKRGFHHKRGFKGHGHYRHRSLSRHHPGFARHHRGVRHRGFIHHRPKHRSRIIIKKRF